MKIFSVFIRSFSRTVALLGLKSTTSGSLFFASSPSLSPLSRAFTRIRQNQLINLRFFWHKTFLNIMTASQIIFHSTLFARALLLLGRLTCSAIQSFSAQFDDARARTDHKLQQKTRTIFVSRIVRVCYVMVVWQ